MEPQQKFNIFPWTEKVHEQFYAAFSLDDGDAILGETVSYMTHASNVELNCILEEENYSRAESLQIILKDYVLHLHLRNAFLNKVEELKRYALKFLSCFLDLHFFLSKDNPESAYSERAIQHLFLCLNGDNIKMWDVLLHCRLLKKKYSDVSYPVLRRILDVKVEHPLEPCEYLKYILLLRLWKVFSPHKEEKYAIANLAGGVTLTENFITYLDSVYSVKKLKISRNISTQKLGNIFICKKFPRDFFKKMRVMLCTDYDFSTKVTTTSQPHSTIKKLFYFPSKDQNIVNSTTDFELDVRGANSVNLTSLAEQSNKCVFPGSSDVSPKIKKQKPNLSVKKSFSDGEVSGDDVISDSESYEPSDLKKKRKRASENNELSFQTSDNPNTAHEHLRSSTYFEIDKVEYKNLQSYKKMKNEDVCGKFIDVVNNKTDMFRTDPNETSNDQSKVHDSNNESNNALDSSITCLCDENSATPVITDIQLAKVEYINPDGSVESAAGRTEVCVNKEEKYSNCEVDSVSLIGKMKTVCEARGCVLPNTIGKIEINAIENGKCSTVVENGDTNSKLDIEQKCTGVSKLNASGAHKGDFIVSFGDAQIEKNREETIKVNESRENMKKENDSKDSVQRKEPTSTEFKHNKISHACDVQAPGIMSTVHSKLSADVETESCLNSVFSLTDKTAYKNCGPIVPTLKLQTSASESKSCVGIFHGSYQGSHNAVQKISSETDMYVKNDKHVMNNDILLADFSSCGKVNLNDDENVGLAIDFALDSDKKQNDHDHFYNTISDNNASEIPKSPAILKDANTPVPCISWSSEITDQESVSNTKASEDCKETAITRSEIQDSDKDFCSPTSSDIADAIMHLTLRNTSTRNKPSSRRKEIVPSTALFLKRSNRIKKLFASDNRCPATRRLKQLKLDPSQFISSPTLRSSPRRAKMERNAVTTDRLPLQQCKLSFSALNKGEHVSKNAEGKPKAEGACAANRKHTESKKETHLLRGYNLRTRQKEKKP